MNEEAFGLATPNRDDALCAPRPYQSKYDLPLGFLDPLSTATTVAALLGGSSSGSPELSTADASALPQRSDSPIIPPPSASAVRGGGVDAASVDATRRTNASPPQAVRSSESTLTANGWSSGDRGLPSMAVAASGAERSNVSVSISIPNVADGASPLASVDQVGSGGATSTEPDAVGLNSISAIALGAEKGSPERLRLLLLDHADREAAFYAYDRAARRRVAALYASILSHNDRVHANLKRFFQHSADTGAASTPPQTDKFVPIRIPPQFIDPVTHRLMGDPVVFLEKRIVDRSVAEALVFRLFSTMIRCNAVGTTKRREFFTYCLERVLVSSVAKQWSREVFGFHGLQMAPRRDIGLEFEQWVLGVLALHKDVRDTVEDTIRDELGMPSCTTGNDARAISDPGATATTTTTIVVGTATIVIGDFASTPPFSKELQRAIGDKEPKAWDTLEHMWRDACFLAVRGRKKQVSTVVGGARKKHRPPSLDALAATAAAVRRRCSQSREPSYDRGTAATPHQSSVSAPEDSTAGASLLGWQCPSIDIGVGIADSTSADVVLAKVEALIADEASARLGVEASILKDIETIEAAVSVEMDDAVRLMRQPRRRVSTTSSSIMRFSTMSGGKQPVGAATPRSTSPAAMGESSERRRGTDKKSHYLVRHRVVNEAGTNHRAPHRPGQLGGVFLCSSLRPPSSAVQPIGLLDAEEEQTSSLPLVPVQGAVASRKDEETLSSAAAVAPQPHECKKEDGPLAAAPCVAPDAPEDSGRPSLVNALDSLTGIAKCVRVPRKLEEIAIPREGGAPMISAEEVALVSAAMRFHQDHELFDIVFDFKEKWFLDLEHRATKWAEAQFNHMAEQQALQRTLGTKKHQQQRAVLRPHTCVVARQPRQPQTQQKPSATAAPRRTAHQQRAAAVTHRGTQKRQPDDPAAVDPDPQVHRSAPPQTRVDAAATEDAHHDGEAVPHGTMAVGDTVSPLGANEPAAPPSDDSVDAGGAEPTHVHVAAHDAVATSARSADKTSPSSHATPSHHRVSPPAAAGIQPSNGWRQRIPSAGIGTSYEQPMSSARASTQAPPSPPRPQMQPDVAVAVAMKTVDGPLSYMTPELATNYVQLKPSWVGNPRHASRRAKPSPSSRFVDDDYIAPPYNEEFPTDHLLRELEAMYVKYDEGDVQKDALRKRELGPYFFEPILYAEEVARKAKERHECIAQQIAKVTNKQLKAHWGDKVADPASANVTTGPAGGSEGASLNLSPRTVHHPKVPLRPHSSTVSARHWLAAVQTGINAAGKLSPAVCRASVSATSARCPANDAPPIAHDESIAKLYAARFDGRAPFLPKVVGRSA